MITDIRELLDNINGLQAQPEANFDEALERFRAYGVPRVRRLDYLVIDRHRLAGLNTIGKVNCNYSGFAGGVATCAREILSRTEQYWSPIQHARRVPGTHERYTEFSPCGDAEGYQTGLRRKREELHRIGKQDRLADPEA